MKIIVSAPGFASMQAKFRGSGIAQIPSILKARMRPGIKIGGVIVSEDGSPVAGAGIQMNCYLRHYDKKTFGPAFNHLKLETDSEGRWQLENFSPKLQAGDTLMMTAVHPEHVQLIEGREVGTPGYSLDAFKTGTARFVMRRGVAVSGTVRDAGGQVVAGANVLIGDNLYTDNCVKVESDEQGRFQVRMTPGEPFICTVQAAGFGPQMEEVPEPNAAAPLNFVLQPGRSVRGRVVDPQGNPLGNVHVSVGQWKDRRTLDWSTTSDAQGEFVWNDAPEGPVFISAYLDGYHAQRLKSEHHDENLQLIMSPELRIRGHVVDHATGVPIRQFKVIHGFQATKESGALAWGQAQGFTTENGNYAVKFAQENRRHAVMIFAEGYAPVESPLYTPEAGDIEFNVRLKRAGGPSGLVVDAQGAGLEGAEVIHVSSSAGFRMTNGSIHDGSEYHATLSGESGEFQLPPLPGRQSLIVLHERGFASAGVEGSQTSIKLNLAPWAELSGKVTLKGAKWTNVPIDFALDIGQELPLIYRCRIDAEGNFSFGKVPPGRGRIYVKQGRSEIEFSRMLDLQPGEVRELEVGGDGMDVRGVAGVQTKLENNERMLAVLYGAERRMYSALAVQPDGRFTLDGLPAGDYTLELKLQTSGGDYKAKSKRIRFQVDPMPGRNSLDLGNIMMSTPSS